MKTILKSFLLLGILYSTTINVPGDYPTIQEGIDASNNGGLSWYSLEETNQNSNSWTRHQFVLNELTNQMQFRFIAEDISYPGDDGSGGSIIEAAVDDFKILIFNDNTLIGDANYDGLLNILDVVLIVAMILDNQPEDLVADINGDGGINIQDIILLINIILSSE